MAPVKALAAIVVLAALIAGCTQTVTSSVTGVTIKPGAITLDVNATQALTADVTVVGGAAKTVTWTSDNHAIATVSSTGVVTGNAVGTAKITATSTADKSKSDTITATVQAAPTTIPTINSFSASPAAIAEGDTTTLSWDVSGASSYSLSDGTSSITIPQQATDSVILTPTGTGPVTYTLTATNSVGNATAQSIVTVTAASAAPTISTFTATPNPVDSGSATTLAWDSSGATSWSLSDGSNTITIPQSATGSVDVTPTANNTVYTLTATNSQGNDTATVTVTFTAPVITNLTATNAMHSTVDLSWTATNATSYEVFSVLSTDPTNQQSIDSGLTSTSDTVAIPASTRQTLRVVATGPGGTDSADVTLQNVVTSSQDYDPYHLQGFTPETAIPGTLRYVLDNAPAGAVIGFASDVTAITMPGVDTVFESGVGTIDSHLIIHRDVTVSAPLSGVTITGTSAAPISDTAAQRYTWNSRMVYVMPGTTVTLDGLTIQGGGFIYSGAGIRNEGDLTVSNSTITGNRAWYEGGGIWNGQGSTLTLVDSHVDGNQSLVRNGELNQTFTIRDPVGTATTTLSDGGYGGGIVNAPNGTISIDTTTFDGNEAKFSGGAIYDEGGTITMTNSPVSNNTASYATYFHDSNAFSYGGGIATTGTLTFSNADFTNNTAANLGGGFALNQNGTATLNTVHFDGNHADYGGGIDHDYCTDPSNLTLNSVTYGTNTATTANPDILLNDVCATTPVVAPAHITKLYPNPATLR